MCENTLIIKKKGIDMKNRNVILTLITIFVLFPFFIISTIAIDNPDYTETILPGQTFVLGGNLNEGEIVRIEYEVVSGGNKDVDFYIKNSTEDIIIDLGRVTGYGLYHFNIPYDDYFKIVFSNTFSLITSKVIEIKIDIVKTITITSPINTDTFSPGYNYITWTTTGDISYVQIDLYRNGVYLETLSSYADNDGSYSWYIYDDEYTDSSYYQIKISDSYDANIYDYNDYFTIETEIKTITITSPLNIYTFSPGSNSITWTSTGDISYVRIELYVGNTFLEVIDPSVYNDGSYSWYFSSSDAYEGSNYRIRISDYYDDSIYDYSEYFTIESEVVNQPMSNIMLSIMSFLIPIIIIVLVITIAVVLIYRRRKQIIPISRDVPVKEGPVKSQEKVLPRIIYCSSCGTEALKAGDFCSECGASIK